MMGTTHLAFGLLLYVMFIRVFQIPFGDVYHLAAVVLGSLLPDIDHPNSLISRQSLFSVVSKGVTRITEHRKQTHSLLLASIATGGVAVVVLNYRADLMIPVVFAIGYVSHLVADSLTRSGVPWLWPFRKGRLSSGMYTSGWEEKIFFWVCVADLLWLLSNP